MCVAVSGLNLNLNPKQNYVLHFQNENEVATFNLSSLMFHAKNELCAGSKIPYPTLKVFKRKLKEVKTQEGKQKKKFELLKEIKNTVRKQENQGQGGFPLLLKILKPKRLPQGYRDEI